MALDAVPERSNLRRYLDNVMAAANRAKDLVDQILAFTQPGSRERVPVRPYSRCRKTGCSRLPSTRSS
ncbi:MAG: hypothetical protein ACREXY_03385 [Gammaproteobacteria bacterium]